MDKFTRNLKYSEIPASYEYLHSNIDLTDLNQNKTTPITSIYKSFKKSNYNNYNPANTNKRFSIIIKDEMMNLKIMSSKAYDAFYKQMSESLDIDKSYNNDMQVSEKLDKQ